MLLFASGLLSEASAQSLFQNLFGSLFKSSPPKSAPATTTAPAPSANFPGAHHGANFRFDNYQYSPRNTSRPPSTGGAYRTICVRTCDGYYFPVSGSASRSKFSEDAEACSARCSGGQLYYLPSHSEDMAAMVDLSGRRYDQLPNAFKYRKKLINGCACRPMPWSAAERARHNRYAYAEQMSKQNEDRARQLRDEALARKSGHEDKDGGPQRDLNIAFDLEKTGIAAKSAVNNLVDTTRNDADSSSGLLSAGNDDAYLAEVRLAISGNPDGYQPVGRHTKSITHDVNYTVTPSGKTGRRTRKISGRRQAAKRNSAPAASWSLVGGGKYTWPGDR